MITWTCRNWGTRAQGRLYKITIKATHDDDDDDDEAVERWTTGLSYMIDHAENNKLKQYHISEDVHMVALTLKKHQYDPLIQQLSTDLLSRIAKLEQAPQYKKHEDRFTMHNDRDLNLTCQESQKTSPKKTYAQAATLNCMPGQLVFEDESARHQRREYKKNKKQW